jgi:uncharacterized protein YndB with AHSA1/START domain
MPYDYTLTALIPASPKEIYETWLDSRGHSAMTGGKATQSAKVGAAVTAWGDYITGKNLHLEPGKRIVQTWRTTQFTDAHTDSVVTVTLVKVAGGTRLTLNHANVPDDQTSYEESGWKAHYFTPMQRYFMTMTNVTAVIERAKQTAKKTYTRKTTIADAATKGVKKKTAKKAATKKVVKTRKAAKSATRNTAEKKKN